MHSTHGTEFSDPRPKEYLRITCTIPTEEMGADGKPKPCAVFKVYRIKPKPNEVGGMTPEEIQRVIVGRTQQALAKFFHDHLEHFHQNETKVVTDSVTKVTNHLVMQYLSHMIHTEQE